MEAIDYSYVTKPFLKTLNLSTDKFDDYINDCRKVSVDGFVAVLRGKRMKNFHTFFNEIAAALQFPWYFGDNWNALIECIQDLSWLNKKYYILGIDQSSSVLSEEMPDDYFAFVKLLEETCNVFSKPFDLNKPWGRTEKAFHIFLQQDEVKV